MNNLTKEEELILRILKRSLSGQGHLAEKNPGRIEWNRFLILAERHEIMSLLFPAMPVETPKEIMDAIRLRARQTVQKFYRIFFLTKQYVRLLENEGIRVFVLKGISAATPYPVPEYRKSGDLDLFVPDEKEFLRAEEILKNNALFRDPVQTEHHCTVYHHPEGLSVELHRAFIEDVDEEEINQKLKSLTEELPGHIVQNELLKTKFPMLEAPYQAFSLLLHMLHHYLHAGFGLRLLCDWVVFWNNKVSTRDRDKYLSLVKEFGLTGFSEFVTAICTEELGLPEGTIHPHLAKSKESYLFFLKDIFESGEFGDDDDSRMVLLRGTGFLDYFREFHHQMRLHYPKASKIFLTWPVLWILTLIRFLRNNHSVRNTTMMDVIKNSRERSVNTGKLELFRR